MNKQTILITGSSRGIGKAIATSAYKQGYRVIVHGKAESENLETIHNKLSGSYRIAFDISDQKAVLTGIKKIEENLGPINVLVNNAGVRANPMGDMEDLNVEGARQEWDTNVLGSLYCIQGVLPQMITKGKGSVISISSIKGHFNLATTSSLTFSATKSGIISITKSLAKTYAEKGIRFNSISPGYVETDQVKDWNTDTLDRIKKGTLAGRMAKPEEIAEIVLYLASDQANYVIGTDYLVDGGYSIKGK